VPMLERERESADTTDLGRPCGQEVERQAILG